VKSWQTPPVVLLCGTLILLVTFGTRNVYGLLLAPVSAELGWGREVFAFAVAFQSIIWGAATPVCGALADKYGPARIIVFGGLTYAAGLAMMAFARTPMDATISIGVLTGFGMSAAGFPIILAVIGRIVAPEKRSLYLGIASAGGSSGQLVLVPLGQTLIDGMGWASALVIFAALVACIVPMSAALAGGHRAGAGSIRMTQTLGAALREATRHKGYLLLTAGYFVCGFQTMFIGAHLPALLADHHMAGWLAALALSMIGFFNIIGCFAWGWLGGRYSKKYLLSALYFGRSAIMLVFIVLPVTEESVIAFSAAMGILWLATVPLTGALVAQIFGTQYMSMLYGITFFSHQLGSFLGIWLGGRLYDLTGNYDVVWWGGIVLGLVAALIHWPINERPLARLAVQER
jgi:MFS family permease